MNNIKDIVKSAKDAIDLIENGKTYTSSYINDRFAAASDGNPNDQLISNMREVLSSASRSNNYITQRQIGMLYDEMYGLSGGNTAFRDALGDLLPDGHNIVFSDKKDYSGNRIDVTADINTGNIESLNDLADSFSRLFSLSSRETPGRYSSNLDSRVENIVGLQLSSIGCPPSSVKVARRNDHFALCIASYDSEDWTTVSVKIPVQITNDVVREPQGFIQDDEIVDMTRENMYVHLKDSSNRAKMSSRNKFSEERRIDSLSTDKVIMPASLEGLADIDDSLVVAASSFSAAEVGNARSVLDAELSSIGIKSSQISVHSSDERCVNLSARIPTGSGGLDIVVPIEIVGGNTTMPSKFIVSSNGKDYVHNFDVESIRNLIIESSGSNDPTSIRDSGPLIGMSYHELMDNMINGVSSGDYRLAEDSLSEIGNRFDSDHYVKALDRFSELLKLSSAMKADSSTVKKAFADGHIINVPTSVEPYCPSLGLPLSKIYFDEKGRPHAKRSSKKLENLSESGSHISTNKIVLT